MNSGTKYCSTCGFANTEDKKFCVKCGNPLGAGAATVSRPLGVHPEKTSLTGTLKDWFQLSGGQTWKQRIWVLGVVFSGFVMLVSTWLPWGSESGLSLSGWQWYEIGRITITESGNVGTPLFIYTEGHPLFTGLFTMTLSLAILMCALLLLINGTRSIAVVLTVLTSLMLIVAITNLISQVTLQDWSAGAGIVLMWVFSILAFAGSIVCIRVMPKAGNLKNAYGY